jgi:hypothetical protein
VQLARKQANTHSDMAINLRLAGRRWHEMAAGLALIRRNTANMDLFSFQGAREPKPGTS